MLVNAIVAGHIIRSRIAELLEQRCGGCKEIMESVVKREHDAARWKRTASQTTRGFAQRQYHVSPVTQDLEPPLQESRRHEQRPIPLVFVLQRHTVVAEDE